MHRLKTNQRLPFNHAYLAVNSSVRLSSLRSGRLFVSARVDELEVGHTSAVGRRTTYPSLVKNCNRMFSGPGICGLTYIIKMHKTFQSVTIHIGPSCISAQALQPIINFHWHFDEHSIIAISVKQHVRHNLCLAIFIIKKTNKSFHGRSSLTIIVTKLAKWT
jgi:hypothetical protein